MVDTKHQVFISFYHSDDEKFKDALERDFGHLMICKSVDDGEIDQDNSDDYIKRLIQEEHITDDSVVVVLIGPNTRKRKHVDWELYAGLTAKAGDHSGLLGVYLPDLPTNSTNKWEYDDMPQRYADNRRSNYASFCGWQTLISGEEKFNNLIEKAFTNRVTLKNKIDNSRPQMQRNLS